jgi:type II secretory pathway pseudopilin PulG
MRKVNRSERGISLVEMVVVVAIIMIVTATSVIQTPGSFANYRANSAMDITMSQLRIARQLGISQRRAVLITFNTGVNPPTVSYQVQARPNVAGDTVGPVVTQPLPGQTSFMEESGVPDTPMGFGTCSGSPVCIGGTCVPGSMYFTSTGQFSSDQDGVFPCNGTLFIGMTSKPFTARAVTIMGATGRVRPYTFIGQIGGSPAQVWTE